MKNLVTILLCCILAITLMTAGCGKKADETKPVSEVQADAAKMDTAKLRAMAETYKEAIVAKKDEVAKVAAELKKIPVTEMLGDEAKSLKADIENLNKSVSALTERFQVYYNQLKEKGGDVSGLDI